MNQKTLKRGLAVVAAAALLLPSSFAIPAEAATKTLTVAYDGEPAPSGLDPILYSDDQTLLFGSMYDSLFLPSGKSGVKSGIGLNPMLSADNTVLTFSVRPGVKFSDGTDLTADVVKANLDRRLSDPDNKLIAYNAFKKGGAHEIKSVAVSGSDVTITFADKTENAARLFALDSGFIICAKGLADSAWLKTHDCGTGAYKLQSVVSGSSYTMVKKSGSHWNAKSLPYGKVVYRILADAQARANALATGQIDVARVTGKTLPLLKAKKVGIVKLGGKIYEFTWWSGGQNPAFGGPVGLTGDKNVRLALSYAIDRAAFVKQLFPGDAPTANFIPAGEPGYDATLNTAYKYNLAKAKQLLAAAGASNLKLEVILAPGSDTAPMNAIKAQWAKAGVDLTVTVAQAIGQFFGAVATEPFGPNDVPMSGIPQQIQVIASSVIGGYGNLKKTVDTAVQGAFDATAANPSPANLKALNRILVNQAWVLPIKEGFDYLGYNGKKVKKVASSSGYIWPILSDIKPVK